MSLHNFNPNNKSWKMYTNTITSINSDDILIKPHPGKNLLLEVSGNNNIFFKKGDISYGLEDLIGGGNSNITLTSISGNIIPSIDNAFKLGDASKNWSNAYINDLSVTNISVSENFILNISGSMTNITDIFNNLGDTFNTIGTSIDSIEYNVIDLSNNKAPLANPTFTGVVNLPTTVIAGHCVPSTGNTYFLGGTNGVSTFFWLGIYGITLHFFFTVVYSDDRLKHNEAIIINGLDIIDKLTPKFYQKTFEMLDADYNGDLSANTWNYEAGLIAQEVLKISDLSFCVSGGDHYDESNNLIKEPYGVNYNNIFVYGLAAIKELHTKVKAQETIITSLIARIEVLEKFK